MANIQIKGKRVTDLEEATVVTGNETLLMADEGGVSKQVKINKVRENVSWNNLKEKPSWVGDKKPTYTASEVGALPSTTQIPKKTSQLENDSQFVDEERVRQLEEKLAQLDYLKNGDFYVAGWDKDDLSPKAITAKGDLAFAKRWHFYLLDTTDNSGITTTPVGKLMKGNLLRFEDGSFAPTVGITEEMRAECDVTLYLDPEQNKKYCDAGTFDAAAFYNEHGMAKLYNEAGAEVRVLRPWETVETKYTIGVGRDEAIYVLDNTEGKSGVLWNGIFSKPVVWDGIDISKYRLAPTAISPCPSCTVNNQSRAFFYLYAGENNCQSSKGEADLCDMFVNQRTYARVADVHQITNMTSARNNNADKNLPYPFAEGGFFALDSYIVSMEAAYKSRYLHENTLFSSGISNNDSCSNESTWKSNGGVRYKLHSSGGWTYATWTATGNICVNAEKKKVNFNILLNKEHPKEQVMESQMAASFAKERGIAEGVEFEFYGGTYWYYPANRSEGLDNMDVRVYKHMEHTFSAFDTNGSPAEFDVALVLRMGLCGGVNLSGDVFAYWGGGYEQVGTVDHDPSVSAIDFPIELYLQPDQTLWTRETASVKDNLGRFGFEDSYLHIASIKSLANGYAAARQGYSSRKTKTGGSLSTGQCFFANVQNSWGTKLNNRVRIAARFRGNATFGYCSARCLLAIHSCAIANRYFAGSVQALIGAAEKRSDERSVVKRS